MRFSYGVLGILAVLASSSPASAATLDFSSAAFAPGNGQSSFAYTANDGVTLTLAAGPAWTGARLSHDSTDGFGVRTPLDDSPDEVDGVESLTLSFSQGVNVSDVFITDLFNEGYLERGSYSINGGSAVSFSALSGQGNGTNGALTLDIDTIVTSLTFSAPAAGLFRQNDFSIKGIAYTVAASTTQVPELSGSAAPLAVMLLVGCAQLVGARRKRSVV